MHMRDIRFEWDEAKSRENKRKHGVSFEEAQSVFYDENAIRYLTRIIRPTKIAS